MPSARQLILKRLADSHNAAVERVVECALEATTGDDQASLVDVLVRRNHRTGWIAMIRQFDRMSPELQDKLLDHPRELFGPLSEAIGDNQGAGRTNVIEIIRKASDPRLVLLLIEALSDSREEVRQLAARSFVDAIRAYRAGGDPEGNDPPADPARLRRAVEFAVMQYKTHRQADVVTAALLFERIQDGPLWPMFSEPHDEVTRTAANMLRNLGDPGMVGAAILALTSPLKAAALHGLSAADDPEVTARIARESYRQLDPVVHRAAEALSHFQMLDELPEEAPWNDDNWLEWFRLVGRTGLAPNRKFAWYVRMLETTPAGDLGVPRKLMLLQAINRLEIADSLAIITALASDPDARVARSAKRALHLRKHTERNGAQSGQPGTAASVKKIMGGAAVPGQFDRVWKDFAVLPPAVQASSSRTLSTNDAQFVELLKSKLASNNATEVAQGLRMMMNLQRITPFRDQIIALCGHSDARLVASAVKLIGRLEDPKLGNLLEAAAKHTDARVRANAIESMQELRIAGHSTQLLAMLNSRFNRERANAIRAISEFDFSCARECLVRMLNDNNAHHRLSALWVVGQLGMLDIVRQVASTARLDGNPRVRKLAREMLVQLNDAASIQSARD